MTAERDFYTRHYSGGLTPDAQSPHDQTFGPSHRYALVASQLRVAPPGGTLVELGCSRGNTLRALSRLNKFKSVLGIDLAFGNGGTIDGVSFQAANLNEPWPLEDGSVDFLVALMVIEHLFDPFHSFAEIRRVLRPTGSAFVNLPLVTSLPNRARLLIGRLPITSVPQERWFIDREGDGNHLHYFSVPSIAALANATGLRVTRTRGVGRFHQLKTLLPSLLASEATFQMVPA
jgi:SAM-dependent methyltransferase